MPSLVKGLCHIIHAIKHNGNECKCLAGFMALIQGLCEQQAAESLALAFDHDAKPRENGDR
jgi:hypothetical protein